MDWSTLGFQGLGQLLNTHPVFVHFPIALFPTAFLFYAIGILRKRHDLLLAGQICLTLALAGLVAAVWTGYFAQETFSHGEALHRMMETHESIGFIALGLAIPLSIWSFLKREGQPRAPKLFLLFLGVAVLVIFQNGDIGSRMVFVEGAAVKTESRRPPAETLPHQHDGHDHHH